MSHRNSMDRDILPSLRSHCLRHHIHIPALSSKNREHGSPAAFSIVLRLRRNLSSTFSRMEARRLQQVTDLQCDFEHACAMYLAVG